MSFYNVSSIAWLNRPYLDLGSSNGGAFHLYGIELDYDNLVDENPELSCGVQIKYGPYFRDSLYREIGMPQYQVKNPLQLATELQTDRWQKLCDYLRNYQDLQPSTKLKVVNLLSSLSFHECVFEYVPEISTADLAKDRTLASLALKKTLSNLMLHLDYGTPYSIGEMERIATNAVPGTSEKLAASLQVVLHYSRIDRDPASVEFWKSVAAKELENLKLTVDEFDFKLLASIYHRAAVFVNLLSRDRDKVIEEMDICQHYADSLTSEHKIQQIVAKENQNVVLEARTKEALWLRDIDLAEERARKLVKGDPFDVRYHTILGEILMKQRKLEEAITAYQTATKLGPPGQVIVFFMMGQCYEVLKEEKLALDCYLGGIQIDPLAISCVKKVANLASPLGHKMLADWSQVRLIELEKQKQDMLTERNDRQKNHFSVGIKAQEEMLS